MRLVNVTLANQTGGVRIAAMIFERWVDLTRHPSTPSEMVRTIRVLVQHAARAEIKMTYRLDGDISRIRVPAPGIPRFATDLWRHTCFEAFMAVDGEPDYHEFNFAPSREWTVYAFSGYRDGAPFASEMMNPCIAIRSDDRRLELDATIRLNGLSANHLRAPLRLGLSAVIEADDELSYWALRHPADKPDFHDANGFALLLEPPSSAG